MRLGGIESDKIWLDEDGWEWVGLKAIRSDWMRMDGSGWD